MRHHGLNRATTLSLDRRTPLDRQITTCVWLTSSYSVVFQKRGEHMRMAQNRVALNPTYDLS